MKRRRCPRLLSCFLLAALVVPAFAVTWTYYKYISPWVILEWPLTTPFKVYKGERVTFHAIYRDMDKKVDDSCPPQTKYYYGSPFEEEWKITGKASFSSTSSVKAKTINSATSGNVYVYIGNDFGGTDTITVSVKLNDKSTNGPPGSDNDGAPCRTKSWTMTVKTKCPTDMNCYSPTPCTGEKPSPTTYRYQMLPDLAPPGPSDYQGVSIDELFGTVSSNINKDTHITQQGRNKYPTWGNNEWRDYYFGGPTTNGTFVVDSLDRIHDGMGGFFVTGGDTSYLVSPPPTDLYWQIPQTYKCNSDNGNLSKAYTVRLTWKANGSHKISKW